MSGQVPSLDHTAMRQLWRGWWNRWMHDAVGVLGGTRRSSWLVVIRDQNYTKSGSEPELGLFTKKAPLGNAKKMQYFSESLVQKIRCQFLAMPWEALWSLSLTAQIGRPRSSYCCSRTQERLE